MQFRHNKLAMKKFKMLDDELQEIVHTSKTEADLTSKNKINQNNDNI